MRRACEYAAGQRQRRLAGAQRAAAGDAGAADDEPFEPGEHRALQTAGARIGHQRHAPAAREQFARQRLGGEEVAARAAGGDHDGKRRGSSHGTSPWCRRRVSASSMPMPSATASADDPP